MRSPDLTASIGNKLLLKNPVMNAAGVLGATSSLLKRVSTMGVSAVVTKTIYQEKKYGNPTPCIIQVPGVNNTVLNSVMGNSPEWPEKKEDLLDLVANCNIPVIASISGEGAVISTEFIEEVSELGFSALEINLGKYLIDDQYNYVFSSPYTTDQLYRMVKKIRARVKIPLFIKLSANVPCIARDAAAAEKAGADCIVSCNTIGPGMVIDVETGIPVLSNKEGFGGMSGAAIKPIGIRCVADIAKTVKIPIIGVGGIMNGRDAVEYLMAGASAVQVGTAVAFRGLNVYKEIVDEIEEYMVKKRYSNLDEIIGLSQKYLESRSSRTRTLLKSSLKED